MTAQMEEKEEREKRGGLSTGLSFFLSLSARVQLTGPVRERESERESRICSPPLPRSFLLSFFFFFFDRSSSAHVYTHTHIHPSFLPSFPSKRATEACFCAVQLSLSLSLVHSEVHSVGSTATVSLTSLTYSIFDRPNRSRLRKEGRKEGRKGTNTCTTRDTHHSNVCVRVCTCVRVYDCMTECGCGCGWLT